MLRVFAVLTADAYEKLSPNSVLAHLSSLCD